MRNPHRRWALALMVAVSSSPALAGWTAAGEPRVSFLATGPAGFKIEGTSSKVAVKDDGSSLSFSVNLADLDTGIGLRNRHMLEDLEADKYPAVTLVVPLARLTVPDEGKTVDTETKGTWSLHQQSRDLPFKYRATCSAGQCEVEGEGTLNLKDFGIKIRSYLGITVKSEVPIKLKLLLKKP